MKIFIVLLLIFKMGVTFSQEIQGRKSLYKGITVIQPDVSSHSSTFTILYFNKNDSTKFLIDSINLNKHSYSLSPNSQFIAISDAPDEFLISKVTIYNKFKEIVKSCTIDTLQFLHLSDSLSLVSEGNFYSVMERKTSVRFYSKDCVEIINSVPDNFGYVHESLFTKHNYFYFLTIDDTLRCRNDCNAVLFIYDYDFTLIGKQVFPSFRKNYIYKLSEENDGLVSIMLRNNLNEKKIFLNSKGEIVK